jgi:YidC/Oxa1 family membrane protein insertase
MQSFLNGIYNALGAVLAFIYSLVPNLGVSIILLTLIVMLLLYPLTAKQAKSMIAMQRVQPEIKKLQAKYKGDRQKLNEEMMKFYQENKINPLAGCLPLVVQLPIFFALYRVLRDPYKHIPKTGQFSSLYNAFCSGFSQCGKTVNGKLQLHTLSFLGIDLQKTATDPHSSFLVAAPYYILVLLVVFSGLLQTRQAQSRTPVANKQMGTVMKVLPIFFGLISLQFPAGLVLYFFVSNMFRVGQQELIFRRLGTGAAPADGKKPLPTAQPPPVIDVPSKERPPKARAAPDENGDGASPDGEARPEPARVERRAAPKAKPRSPAPQPAMIPEQRERGGGLRAFFQLPPPPPANGGRRPAAAPSRSPGRSNAPRPTSGSTAGDRPPPQRRRRSSKKKRKR